jgi:hypothetical protein
MTTLASSPSFEIPVRFEVGGKVIELDAVNRPVRRMLQKQADKFRKTYARYKDMRDSEGRGVTIVIKSPKTLSLQISVALEFSDELKSQIDGAETAERVEEI